MWTEDKITISLESLTYTALPSYSTVGNTGYSPSKHTFPGLDQRELKLGRVLPAILGIVLERPYARPEIETL